MERFTLHNNIMYSFNELLKEAGLTNVQFAEQFGLGREHWQRKKKQWHNWTLQQVLLASKILKTNPGEVISAVAGDKLNIGAPIGLTEDADIHRRAHAMARAACQDLALTLTDDQFSDFHYELIQHGIRERQSEGFAVISLPSAVRIANEMFSGNAEIH